MTVMQRIVYTSRRLPYVGMMIVRPVVPQQRDETHSGEGQGTMCACVSPGRSLLHISPRLAGRLGPLPGDQMGRESDGEGEEPGDQDTTKVWAIGLCHTST